MNQPLPGDIFNVGQVLNNTYVIDKILGRGGTGEVYRARNKITDRVVAIKALNRQFSGNADYIELMKREEEMRAIQHDAVVRYTECSMSDDGHVFLVMDYVEGPPLSDVMTQRRMDPRELLIIGQRVAEGLVATHAKGIIHRDLSPDNIILRHGDPTKATIIDFGIAKDTAVGARTIVGSDFAGKYEYSAPEQLEGHVSPQSDLYALGTTLLAAWRGETPFLGATPGEIIRRKQAPLDTDSVPAPLRDIIDQLTASDPATRPADAAVLAQQINILLRTGRDSPAAGDDTPKRKKLWPLIGGSVIAAGLAATWLSGAFDRLITPPLPVAAPYKLELTFENSTVPILNGNAPDVEAADRLRTAVTDIHGQQPTGDLTLATGMPDAEWEPQARTLMQQIAGLENGQIAISDRNASVSGLATNTVTKSAMINAIDTFSQSYGWRITTDIVAGPLILSADTLQTALQDFEDCGPLKVDGATDGNFDVIDPITITGNIAGSETGTAITELLKPTVGDRPVIVATQTLNPELCRIWQTVGDIPKNIITFALSDGETGARNLSGVFKTGENPVVDLLIPERYSNGALWLFYVAPDGEFTPLVPHINNEEARIDMLASPENGIYRFRALHTVKEFIADNNLPATRVEDTNYGKSEIIAVVSSRPLFEGRRPSGESLAAIVYALSEFIAEDPDNILGVSSVVIDLRP